MKTIMLHVHHLHPDWTLIQAAALPLSLLLLAASLCLLALALRGGRRALQRDLARIFEQLDLLRFDAQQAAAAAQPPERPAPGAPPPCAAEAVVGNIGDYQAAQQLAACGSGAREIAARCGIVNGEARVLVALQRARGAAAAH